MGWISYYTENTRQYECERVIKSICECYKNENLQCANVIFKGSKCFYLLRGDKGDFIDVMLTSIRNGKFAYKPIGLTNTSNYEYYDIPKSLLKAFRATDKEREKWIKECFAFYAEKKAKPKFNIGEIYKVAFDFDICWGSVKIVKGKEFLIEVCKKPSRKNPKDFIVLEAHNGDFFRTNYLLRRKTLSEAKIIEKIA